MNIKLNTFVILLIASNFIYAVTPSTSYFFITNNTKSDIYLIANNDVIQNISKPFQCIHNISNPIVAHSPEIIFKTFYTLDIGTFSTYVSLIPKGTTVIYLVDPNCNGTTINKKDNFWITPADNVDHILYSYSNFYINRSGLLFGGSTDTADVYYLFSYVNSHNLQGQLTLLQP